MILPTTHTSALFLLIVSLLCLGSWVNTFKLAGSRWRFELFSIDFAIGAALLGVATAFTLGTLGSDLAFSDRMLVAGRTAQAFVFIAGFIFCLGNMLLLAGVSLIGVSSAFPISIGIALIVASFFEFHSGGTLFLIGGIVLVLVAVILSGRASKLQEAARLKAQAAARAEKAAEVAAGAIPATATTTTTTASGVANTTTTPKAAVRGPRNVAHKAAPRRKTGHKATRGIVVSILGGLALGFFYPVASKGMAGDFGVGPYAAVLLFALGILVSTIMFDFYFLNIAIYGEAIGFGTYFQGNAKQHFLGFIGGALWAGGALAAALALNAPAQANIVPGLVTVLPLASVLLVMFWGMTAWKEVADGPSQRGVLLTLTAVLFVCGLALFGLGIGH